MLDVFEILIKQFDKQISSYKLSFDFGIFCFFFLLFINASKTFCFNKKIYMKRVSFYDVLRHIIVAKKVLIQTAIMMF